MTNFYDPLLRRTTNGVLSGADRLTDVRYAYGDFSRLAQVHDTTNRISYSYGADSPNIGQISFYYPFTTLRFTTRKTYDNLDRLTSVVHSNATLGAFSAFRYALNSANQRPAITNADNSRWVYGYDGLGQVTSGKKHWADGQLVAGQQFEYSYDDIGNRKSAASGGNEWGSGLRYENYTVNDLNQYTQRSVPGSVDVLGAATNSATVTVNDHPTYRKGEYFRGDLPLTNTASPVYASITNLAVLANGTNADIVTKIVGNLFLPQTPEVFLHDPDGNLAQDGQWTNRWDAENRWIEAETISSVPAAAKKKLVFAYDHKWRRTRKTVYDWNTNTSAWFVSKDLKFVYDGWNLLAELSATNNAVINCYMWGLDLSGTPQGAGGVGGLLAMKSADTGVHFYGCDGNGNVEALVSATNGAVTAEYAYSPFGQVMRAIGPLANANVFRLSTKYQDDETDLAYYGNRYYGAAGGRWPSRDPIEEYGGFHLYAMVRNNLILFFDKLGQKCCVLTWPLSPYKTIGHAALKCDSGPYVSMWASSSIFGSPSTWHDADDDKAEYPGVAPTQECNDCLDESKVQAWFDKAKADPNMKYNVLSYACSEAVRDAIGAGLPEQKRPKCPKNNCWNLLTGLWVVEDLLEPHCTANSPAPVAGATPPFLISQWFQNLGKNNCQRYKCVKCSPSTGGI